MIPICRESHRSIHAFIRMKGTTIGYGNITPTSDLGRFLLAIYAILACNVVGGFLDLGKGFLESFCLVSETPFSATPSAPPKTETSTKKAD